MEKKKEYIVDIRHIHKEFYGVVALEDVSIQIKRGEVHALLGENGAGKSTIMKILAGIYQSDKGEILYDDEPFAPKTPYDARVRGISMIPQELDLMPDLTVADNIFAGNEITDSFGILKRKQMQKRALDLLEKLNLDIKPNAYLRELSLAKWQMIALVKAIAFNSEVIIMDEPTSAITDRETDKLFKVIDDLRKQNRAIIYISHKLDEIFKISDRITVLRDGKLVDTMPTREVTNDQLVHMMVGRKLTDMYIKTVNQTNNPDDAPGMLKVDALSRNNEFSDISFQVKPGEILGIFGLMGAMRTEIMETVFGLRKAHNGTIEVNGKRIKNIADAIKNGIAFITEDRKLHGLNLIGSVKSNITIVYLKKILKGNLVLNFKKERSLVDKMIQMLRIKVSSREMIVNNLSGGNQQKVVIAKWLMGNPDILIMDEPTRGIDVGSKAEIYRIMNSLTKEGKCIILISSEMPELLGMSDRVIVIHEGRITGEFNRKECNQDKLMACAVGGIG